MGGKTLRFPKRGKYIAPGPKIEEIEEKPISEEEHNSRIEMLKSLGLVK
jgi:hypothetical protein